MGNVDIIVPDRDGPVQMVSAFVAFARALEKRGDVAIVRWIRRANDAPKLYTLWAGMEGPHTCLHAIRHPFVEDIRPCPFPSLRGDKPKTKAADLHISKDELNKVAEALIQNANVEKLDYRNEFNPVIQRFLELVNQKATEGLLDSSGKKGDECCFLRVWGKDAADAVEALEKIVGASSNSDSSAKRVKVEDVKSEDSDLFSQIKEEVGAKSTVGESAVSITNSLKLVAASSQSNSVDVNDPIALFARQWMEDALDAHDTAIANIMLAVDQLVKTSPGERFYERALNWLLKVSNLYISMM